MRKAFQAWVGLSCFIVFPTFGQSQKIADSLRITYQDKSLHDTVRLEVLDHLSFNENNDLTLAIKYADELIALSKRLNNNLYLCKGYYLKGNKNKRLGNLEAALEAYIKSAEVAKQIQYTSGEAGAYSAIATVFKSSNNFVNAMMYFRKAISVTEKVVSRRSP